MYIVRSQRPQRVGRIGVSPRHGDGSAALAAPQRAELLRRCLGGLGVSDADRQRVRRHEGNGSDPDFHGVGPDTVASCQSPLAPETIA